MAFNYYEGWTEEELLDLRKDLQKQLTAGRITEIRLAGESTRTDDAKAAPIEESLKRIAYSLFVLCKAGKTQVEYSDPYAVITIQSHY